MEVSNMMILYGICVILALFIYTYISTGNKNEMNNLGTYKEYVDKETGVCYMVTKNGLSVLYNSDGSVKTKEVK